MAEGLMPQSAPLILWSHHFPRVADMELQHFCKQGTTDHFAVKYDSFFVYICVMLRLDSTNVNILQR
jgi:hypothetical protein